MHLVTHYHVYLLLGIMPVCSSRQFKSTTELKHIQKNFGDSNTDGSFTTAVSNSVLESLEKNPLVADLG